MTTTPGFRGVRVSKFRHVYGQSSKRESCYEGLRITTSAHDSQFCAVNPKFVAVAIDVAGGGAFQVLPLNLTGKVGYQIGRVSGHKGPVTDLKWNPFNDNIIASSSDDATIKLWHIEDEGVITDRKECLCELRGHTRRVTYMLWHPTAEGLLASVSTDCRLLIWNVTSGECVVAIDAHPDLVNCMSFNKCGSLIATTCKDHMLRIIDVRTGQLIHEAVCHDGSKSSKVVFLGDRERLVTTGFSRTSRRQFALWNQNDLSRPLVMQDVDSSSGVLFPFFDQDLNILYIAGKGDGNIRYYEMIDSHPWMHYLSEFQSRFPHRGLGFMPKRALDVSINEIFRFYKVHSTQALIEPISFIVPRKSETFQCDLYPATPGYTPALSAEEFLCGMDRDPVVVSLRGGFVPTTSKPVHIKREGKDGQPTLIACDKNNERKFRFLSQITKPDYRDIEQREDKEKLVKDEKLLQKLKEQKLRIHQNEAHVKLSGTPCSPVSSPRGGVRSEEEMYVSCLSPPSPRSPGAMSAPTGSLAQLSRVGHHLAGHSPTKIRRISHSPNVPQPIHESLPLNTTPPKAELDSSDGLSSPSPPLGITSNGSECSSRRLSSPPPLRGSVDHSRLPALTRPQPIKSTGSVGSFRPPISGPSKLSKITRPGCIGPGAIVHKEAPQQAHIRPFRISASQPPLTKPDPSAKTEPLPATQNNQESPDLRKLYSGQCARVRELMSNNEVNDRRVTQLESDVTGLTHRLETSLTELRVQQDDVKSLRYEIQWKNDRIEYLESMLKESSPRDRLETLSSPEPDL